MKRIVQRLSLVVLLLLPMMMRGQQTLIVADGTATNEYVPLYGWYADAVQHNQMIYPASMLSSMNGAEVSKMVFYCSPGSNSADLGNWIVSIGETSATTLSGLDASTSRVQVYSGSLDIDFDASPITVTITFSEPYLYHGGNLLVDFNHPIGAQYRHLYFLGISATDAAYTYNNRRSFLPKVEFSYEIPASCPKPESLTVAPTTSSAAISWTAATGVSNYLLTLNGAKVADVAGTSYSLTGLTANTAYTVGVSSLCTEGDTTSPVSASFRTPCAAYELPLATAFNSDDEQLFCWSTLAGAANVTSSGSYHLLNANGSDDPTLIVMPEFAIPTTGVSLTFDVRRDNYYYNYTLESAGKFEVGYITNLADVSTFVALETYTYADNSNTFQTKQLLSRDIPAGARIAFRAVPTVAADEDYYGNEEYYYYGWDIDNVKVEAMPANMPVLDLAISNLSVTSATATWQPSGWNEPAYQVILVAEGEDLDWSNATIVTDTTIDFSDLTAYTDYKVYVRSCAADGSDPSDSVFAAFLTLPNCEDGFQGAQFAYEGAETIQQEVPFASRQYAFGASWQIFTVKNLRSADKYILPGEIKGLAWNYAGPDSAEAIFSIYMAETSKAVFGNDSLAAALDTMDRNEMTLVYFDTMKFNSGWNEIKFDTPFHYNADSNLMVMVLRDYPVSRDSMFFAVNEGPSIQRFGYYYNHRLDESAEKEYRNDTRYSMCYEIPSCYPVVNPVVTALRTATPILVWETFPESNATEYEVVWDTVNSLDSAIASGNSAIVSDTTYTFMTLDTNTTYYAWVRAICGEGDSSRWIAVDPFATTNCQVVELPFCEYFEEATPYVTPQCWFNYPNAATVQTGSNAYAGTRYLHFSGSTNNVITLPQPNAEIKDVTLSFMLRPESYTYSSCGTFSVGYMTNIDDTTTFKAMNTYAYSEFTNGYEFITVHFQDAPAGAVFAFRANPTVYNYYWYVDNVCMELSADNIYHTVLDTICIDALNNSYVWDHYNRNHTQVLYNLDTLDLSAFVGMPDGTTRTFVFDNGDTTEAVRLVMNQNQIVYDTQVACEKFMWEVNQETYYADTVLTYADDATPALDNGCRLVNGLVLTINMPVLDTIEVASCNYYVFEDTIRASGNYQRTIIEGAANGCDSIINLILTIENIDTNKVENTACYSFTWEVNGETYDTTGVYVYTEEVEGQVCPNIYELTLTINDTIFNVDTLEFTGIYNDTINDTTYINYNANDDLIVDYYDIYTSEVTGCDSIVGRHLVVHPFGVVDYYITSTMDTVFWTVDEGRTYTIISDHDTVINRGYIYTEGPWAGRVGNINRLHFFRINPDTVCSGNEAEVKYYITSVEPCSSCYDSTTFTTDTLLNVISNKEVKDTADATVGTTEDNNDNAENCHKNLQDLRDTCFANNAVSDGIFYLDTVLDEHTRLIYHAVVNPSYDMEYDTVACDQFVWDEADITVTNDTLGLQATLQSINGCDSIVTLNVHIDTTVLNSFDTIVCNEFVWLNGEDTLGVYTESDTISQTLEAATGCDSIVTISLTVNTSPINVIDTVVCGEFTLNNDVYTNDHKEFPRFDTTFTLYDTVGIAANGCDSIDQYNVKIKGIVDDTLLQVSIGSWYDEYLGTTFFIPQTASYLDTFYTYADSLVGLDCEGDNLVRHLRVGYLAYIDQNEFGHCGYYTWNKDWWDSITDNGTLNGDYGWNHGHHNVTYWALDTINDANDRAHRDALYKYYEDSTAIYVYQYDQPRKLDSIYVVQASDITGDDSTMSIDINGVPIIYQPGDTVNNGFPVLWHLNLQLNMARFYDTTIANYPLSLLRDNNNAYTFAPEGISDGNDSTYLFTFTTGDTTADFVGVLDSTKDEQWFTFPYVNMEDNLDPKYCGTIYRIHFQVVNDSVYDSVYICAYENEYLWIDNNTKETIARIPAHFAYNTIRWSLTNDDFDNQLTPDSIAIMAYKAADFVLDTMITLHAGQYSDTAKQKVYNLHMMQYPFVFVTDNVNACESLVWERDGNEYTQPGTYNVTDTLPQYLNGSTCEFNYVLDLTTNYFTTDTVVCDQIEWHDSIYTVSTTDTIIDPKDPTFVASDGTTCDKYFILNVTVNKNVITYRDTNCTKDAEQLAAYKADGFEKVGTDTYYDIYFKDTVTNQTPSGCDSIDRYVVFHYTTPYVAVVDTVICEDDFATVSFFEGGRAFSKPVNANFINIKDTNFVQGCAPDTVYTGSITWSWSTYIFDTAASCGGEAYAWHFAHNYAPDSVIFVDSTATYQYSIEVEGLDCPLASVLCFTMFDAEYDTVTIFHSDLPYLYEKHNIDTLLTEAGDYDHLKWDTTGIDTARYTNLHLEVLPFDTIYVIDSVCYNDTAFYTAGEEITLHLADGSADFTFVTRADTMFNVQNQSGAFNFNFFGYTADADGNLIAEHLLMNTITVLDSHNIIIDTFSCSDFFWIYDEHTYTHDTIVTYTRESSIINPTSQYDIYGCPNRHTLILHFLEYQESFDTIVACSEYVDVNGNVYTTSYDSTDVLEVMESGCNMMHHLNLTINQPSYTDIDTVVCGYFMYRGILLQTSGVATYTYTAANGCDSIVTYHVTVSHPTTTEFTEVACGSYFWRGTIYTTSGIYRDTLQNQFGCDSIVVLNLTINQPVSTEFSVAVCNSYTWNGTTYTESGDYTYEGTTVSGCDSTVTLHLTINTPDTVIVPLVGCASVTTTTGLTFTETGLYPFNFVNMNGCDSIVIYDVTIYQSYVNSITEVACSEFTWEATGLTYTQSGIYTDVNTTIHGCDSITTLNLTINQPVYYTFNDTAALTYTWDGVEYSASGSYTNTYTAANGCDSIVTLNLTITGPATRDYYITAVANDTTFGYTHGSGKYNYGDVATLTAMANEGYRFVSWSNGDTLATIYVTVTSDSFFTATFERISDPQVGIDDVEESEVVIYSADSKIIVRGAENRNVYIFDITGRCVRQQSNVPDTTEFPMENTGVYLVKVGDAPAKRVLVVR